MLPPHHPSALVRALCASLVPLAGVALALSSAGCSFITGEHEAETEFLVKPNTKSDFSGWSEISISEDPQSVDSAELMYATIEARDESVKDLTFIQGVSGDAKVDDVFTRIAEKAPMPSGERIVTLDRVYDGDLRGFFFDNPDKDAYTIHITWRGSVNPAVPIPPEGIWMKVKVGVRVE